MWLFLKKSNYQKLIFIAENEYPNKYTNNQNIVNTYILLTILVEAAMITARTRIVASANEVCVVRSITNSRQPALVEQKTALCGCF